MRPHRDRADRRAARSRAGGGRLLPAAPAGKADHARPSSPRCRSDARSRPSCADDQHRRVMSSAAASTAAPPRCIWPAGLKPSSSRRTTPAAMPRASTPAACASSRGTWPRCRCRSPRWRSGSSIDDSSTTIAASRPRRCWSPRARTSSINFAPASTTRLRGFTHEELIDHAELRRLVPAVADHCPGGVVSRRDGAADPFRTTQALPARQRPGRRRARGRARDRAAHAKARAGGSKPAPAPSRRRRSSTPPAPGPTASPRGSASRCRSR